jgi:hypothetical protein
LATQFADFHAQLGDARLHRFDFAWTRPVIGACPDREQAAQLLDIARVTRFVRHAHQRFPLGAVT